MALSLLYVLSIVALVHARPHATHPAFDDRNSVVAQMFEWNWDSVAAECTRFLGPAGYGFVQVSPAQEHVQGSEWWTDYQPVSYILTSKRGTREQYENMIHRCHAAGVGVIADTIWNHMTARESGKGVAGSDFTRYHFPGIYTDKDFHHCGLEPNDTIVDFGDKTEVWTCELGGFADLATETPHVRGRLAEYTNDLLSLGVDGLRLYAAKYIDTDDISNILSRLTSQPYVTQEVIWGEGQRVTPDLYTGNGEVQEFRYATALKDAFLGPDRISSLKDLENRGWVSGSDANVFVSNHDTERNKVSLNPYSPSNTYTLAHVFSLSHPYGRVSVLSSYANFFDTNAGAPNQGAGQCGEMLSGPHAWLCQHTWHSIAGMVGFRKQVSDAPLKRWVSESSNQIAFARGSDGFVAINNEDSEWSTTFMTGLPEGSYCNVVESPPPKDGKCAGTAFIIGSDGSLDITISARNAIAVHTGALGSETSKPMADIWTPVLFNVNADTFFGENILVMGNVTQLGNWNPSNAIPLDSTNVPEWGGTAYMRPNTAFRYKFIRKQPDGSFISESGPAREDTTPTSGELSIVTSLR